MTQSIVKTLTLLLLVGVLSHCARRDVNVRDEVTDPAADNESLIQINPMVPEAVLVLIDEAATQQSNGHGGEAIMTLKRALTISPASALVQQHLAETYLAEGDFQQAMYWATLVVNQGPDQGSLCERARRAQALSAEMLGNAELQSQALEGVATCSRQPPARY